MVYNFNLKLPEDKTIWDLEREVLDSLFKEYGDCIKCSRGASYTTYWDIYNIRFKGAIILSGSKPNSSEPQVKIDGNLTLIGFDEKSKYFKKFKRDIKSRLNLNNYL